MFGIDSAYYLRSIDEVNKVLQPLSPSLGPSTSTIANRTTLSSSADGIIRDYPLFGTTEVVNYQYIIEHLAGFRGAPGTQLPLHSLAYIPFTKTSDTSYYDTDKQGNQDCIFVQVSDNNSNIHTTPQKSTISVGTGPSANVDASALGDINNRMSQNSLNSRGSQNSHNDIYNIHGHGSKDDAVDTTTSLGYSTLRSSINLPLREPVPLLKQVADIELQPAWTRTTEYLLLDPNITSL